MTWQQGGQENDGEPAHAPTQVRMNGVQTSLGLELQHLRWLLGEQEMTAVSSSSLNDDFVLMGVGGV